MPAALVLGVLKALRHSYGSRAHLTVDQALLDLLVILRGGAWQLVYGAFLEAVLQVRYTTWRSACVTSPAHPPHPTSPFLVALYPANTHP